MTWVLLLVLLSLGALMLVAQRRQAQARELEAAESLRAVTKVADEDVTRFGEELSALHVETLTTELDVPMRQDYQRALDSYENAKDLLRDASRPEDVGGVTRALEDGRYALACVQARAAGQPLPQRRPPCFFNPAHGPAQTDVSWAPGGGAPREVPVCLADADRLAHGAEPDTRQVRQGARMVPWYQGGPAYAPYAGGYYGGFALNGLFPAFILGSMLSGGGWDGSYSDGYADGQADTGSDGGDSGDTGGTDGADYGGDAGGDFGGGDLGGGDFGGDFGDFGF